ncbi:hypothetical protein KP509_19G051800 [Ceratopteris richardii]|nr:hypothetical protein KP509_19G051800 [Ceratopteris richardii]
MKYSSIPSLIDSVNADAPSEAQPLDLSSSSAIEPCSNFNVQLIDASQNLPDMYMSGTDGKESETSPLLMNEAEEKRNLEEEPRDLVHISMANLRELEVENHGYTNKSDMSTDGSLPVADSVSSKPVAEPTSDMPSFGGAGPALAVRPVGLGSSMSLEHAPRAVQRSSGRSMSLYSMGREDSDPLNDTSEGNQETHEKLKGIRIKFLRLVHRLGQPPHNTVVAQVLYRLGLAEQLRGGQGNRHSRSFGLDRASMEAEEQEAMGHDDLEFECTLLLLGKSGVGKSATINSLFDEVKVDTDAFNPATKSVNVVTGTVYGIKLRIIDTPGLSNSFVDQRHNRRVLATVKRMIKKTSPDIVLYFERMDVQLRDFSDLPLLQAITDTFGAAVWFNALIVFTHAACAPPDGTNGSPVNYDLFVSHQSHVLQQSIRQVAGDIRLMNPVSLVENHIACRTNRSGQKVLPNGHVWKSQLLLLCFSSKILAEANAHLKLQDSVSANSLGIRSRVPPLPYLLSSLLQSRAQLRLPDEQGVEDGDSDVELEDDESDSDGEEDYDDLPPFRRLTREELKLLDKEQQRLYFEELEDRERLFMKKLIKEEKERRKQRKRMSMLSKESGKPVGNQNDEENADATVPVAMPDMVLPPSFDSDNPTYRYRYLDSPSQWLVRPVLETHGWDHDNGYDGVNAERTFVLFEKIPASISGQASKDKKEANLQMECAASFKSGFDNTTLAGLEIQSIGRDLAYTVRSETRFSNFKRNKTTCGLAVTKLGDTVVAGMKIEDRLMISKRLKVLVNGGALTGRGDTAYGGSLEASVRGKDYYVNHSLSSLGLSIMNWHGDLAVGGNLQIQVQMGKILYTCRANLNNKGAGQINIRANSSDQVNMVLIGLIPFIRTFINNVILNANETSS